MNDTSLSETAAGAPSREDMQAALFAQLVLQQTNLALMLLGKIANPQTGEITRDLESARLFIDQLEMLEVKTKGNLSHDEGRLLQQSLMSLRMAFVEAVEAPASTTSASEPDSQAPASASPAPGEPTPDAADADSRKKFSKKY
jgi:hypothetical protein